MTPSMAYRLAGLCAIAGGLLRLISIYTYGRFDPQVLQVSWLITDILLLYGLIGIYGFTRRSVGLTGTLGFAIAVAGVLIVRSSGGEVLGPQTYVQGAAVWSLGLAMLGWPMLLRGVGFRVAAALWITSLVIGVFAAMRPGESWGLMLATIAFSAGYIGAGWPLIERVRKGEGK